MNRKNEKKKIVAFNLIAFHDTKAIGTLVFTQRLLKELDKNISNKNYKFVFYIQKHIDIRNIFIMKNCEMEVIKVPSLRTAIKRIVFEQTLFYFYQKRTDVFFTPTLSLPLFAFGKKILTLHDMVPFLVEGKYSKLRNIYIKLTTKLFSMKSDVIITVSDNSKNDICKILSIPTNKVVVIYNFIPADEVVLKQSDFNVKQIAKFPYLLTVSTLQPAKNLDRLIEAFSCLLELYPEYKLYIVGNKGWGYEHLYKISERLGVQDSVIFTGYLNDEELAYMYEHCDGVVYVSLYEGFGIPPLEALACGTTVICSNSTSIPEVCGERVEYFYPKDINSLKKIIYKKTI